MNALILHSSPLQARIWQKLLQSQDWSATIVQQESDLREQVLVGEVEDKLPDVILMADNIPNVKMADFCNWLTTRSQTVPLIALSSLPEQQLTTTQRQLAKAKGAKALLPAFSATTIALEAVKAMKSLATTVDGVTIQNGALMNCIKTLNQEFEQEQQPTNPSNPSITKKTRTYRGQEYVVEVPTIVVPKTGTRRYRGQEY